MLKKYYSTQIGKFIAENNNWETILVKEPYCLRYQRYDGYILFKYNQVESDFSNPIVREARGIIFKEGYWEVPVCHPFDKFFNVGESNADLLDWPTTMVTQKIDGSLIKLWHNDNHWHVSTNGMIDAHQACYSNVESCNFRELFEEALENNNVTFEELTSEMEPGFTYMFELVSPKTRVVIPYDKTDLYYLGLRDNYSNAEMPFYSVNFSLKIPTKVKKPAVYSLHSVTECLKAAQNLPWNEEGYVACDINCNRVKIKSPQYVLAHYGRNNNNVTNETLVGVAISGEQEEFLTYANDYKEALQKVTDAIKKFKNDCVEALNNVKSKTYNDRKEYALEVQKYPENIRPYLFINIDKEMSIDEFTGGWDSKKWLKYIEV